MLLLILLKLYGSYGIILSILIIIGATLIELDSTVSIKESFHFYLFYLYDTGRRTYSSHSDMTTRHILIERTLSIGL